MEVDPADPGQEYDATQFHQVTIRDPIAGADSTFTIPRRYSNLNFLNAGAQGTVVWVTRW